MEVELPVDSYPRESSGSSSEPQVVRQLTAPNYASLLDLLTKLNILSTTSDPLTK